MGLEQAKGYALNCAISTNALRHFDAGAEPLRELARYIERRH